jgi:hypothetical protein
VRWFWLRLLSGILARSSAAEAGLIGGELIGTLRLRSGQAPEAVPFSSRIKIKINFKVNGVGQECPTDMGKVKVKGA